MKALFRLLAHLIFGIRRFNDRCIKDYARDIKNKRILEIGSGKHTDGNDYYSAKKYFDASNEFVQSDVDPEYGHKVVDIVTMDIQEEYNIILCMNVLEHVYEYQQAVDNLYKALKPGGELIVFVPFVYPLHDEPHDYWRFTEHSLRNVFKNFGMIKFQNSGIRQFPVAYFSILRK